MRPSEQHRIHPQAFKMPLSDIDMHNSHSHVPGTTVVYTTAATVDLPAQANYLRCARIK